MAYSAEQIAKYLINKATNNEGGELLSNLKLQKLLYYCQGFFYTITNRRLFNEEIQAWQYGPVVPDVYSQFKRFGSNGIENQGDLDFSLQKDEVEIIDEVFDYFNQFSAIKLMEMTHSEPTWKETPINTVISLDKMKSYFKNHIN